MEVVMKCQFIILVEYSKVTMKNILLNFCLLTQNMIKLNYFKTNRGCLRIKTAPICFNTFFRNIFC